MSGALAWPVPFRRCFNCRLYSGCAGARLWRALPLAGALTLALAGGGCSINTSRFDSLFAGADNSEATGSITPPPGAKEAAGLPPAGDLVYARAAASDVLTRDEKYASAPWENPSTGARGTVTPIASAYTQDGQTCRDFLASYVQRHRRSPGCRAKPASRTRAPGKSARSSPGSGPEFSSVHPRLRGNERDRAGAPARRSSQGEGALHPVRLNPTL